MNKKKAPHRPPAFLAQGIKLVPGQEWYRHSNGDYCWIANISEAGIVTFQNNPGWARVEEMRNARLWEWIENPTPRSQALLDSVCQANAQRLAQAYKDLAELGRKEQELERRRYDLVAEEAIVRGSKRNVLAIIEECEPAKRA